MRSTGLQMMVGSSIFLKLTNGHILIRNWFKERWYSRLIFQNLVHVRQVGLATNTMSIIVLAHQSKELVQ